MFVCLANPDAAKHFKEDRVPFWLSRFDRLAVQSNADDKGLGDGTDFTFGDVAVFEVVNAACGQVKSSVLRGFPNLKQWHDACLRRPAIAKHVQNRPATATF